MDMENNSANDEFEVKFPPSATSLFWRGVDGKTAHEALLSYVSVPSACACGCQEGSDYTADDELLSPEEIIHAVMLLNSTTRMYQVKHAIDGYLWNKEVIEG